MEKRNKSLESTEEKGAFPYQNIPSQHSHCELSPENGKLETKVRGKNRSPCLLLRPARVPPGRRAPSPGQEHGRLPPPPAEQTRTPPSQRPRTRRTRRFKAPQAGGSAPRKKSRPGQGRPLLTVGLLARRPQPAVEAGGPAQAAGRDLACGLLPLPQDVQVAERGARRCRAQRQPSPQRRLWLPFRHRVGRCRGAAALHPLTGRAAVRGRGEGRVIAMATGRDMSARLIAGRSPVGAANGEAVGEVEGRRREAGGGGRAQRRADG